MTERTRFILKVFHFKRAIEQCVQCKDSGKINIILEEFGRRNNFFNKLNELQYLTDGLSTLSSIPRITKYRYTYYSAITSDGERKMKKRKWREWAWLNVAGRTRMNEIFIILEINIESWHYSHLNDLRKLQKDGSSEGSPERHRRPCPWCNLWKHVHKTYSGIVYNLQRDNSKVLEVKWDNFCGFIPSIAANSVRYTWRKWSDQSEPEWPAWHFSAWQCSTKYRNT